MSAKRECPIISQNGSIWIVSLITLVEFPLLGSRSDGAAFHLNPEELKALYSCCHSDSRGLKTAESRTVPAKHGSPNIDITLASPSQSPLPPQFNFPLERISLAHISEPVMSFQPTPTAR